MPTTAQPGDVVLVRFPFTDLTTTKLRPAVVLATHGDDLTILGIFSGPPQPSQPTWIVLSSRDRNFPETGLKTTSVIKAERRRRSKQQSSLPFILTDSIPGHPIVASPDSLQAKMDDVKRLYAPTPLTFHAPRSMSLLKQL